MIAIVEHLRSEGYEIPEFIPDSKIHRFKLDKSDDKKSGFYIGYRNFSEKTGEQFFVVVYGSWRGEDTRTYCSLKGVMSHADKKNIQTKIDEAVKREEAIRKKEQEEVSDEVQRKWELLNLSGASQYLERKQITGDSGIRFDNEGNIYVPARDVNGRLWSYQRIQWDGSKWFHPGGRVRGCFHALGNLTESSEIYIAEGFATAATVFLATGKCTLAAFSAGNLVEVSGIVKKEYPNKSIIVCGDDDKWKDPERNIGREKAEEAAKKTLGSVCFPRFKENSSNGTDFNDLHCMEGIEEVRRQIPDGSSIERNYLFALGFSEKQYFYTSSKNEQIVSVSHFSEVDFLNLMPIEYWEACYPGSGATRVNWQQARSAMMDTAREKGIFESRNVRGAGVWSDDGRVVVNLGNHLIVDGRRCGLGDIKSRYFYTLGSKLPGLNPSPLSAKECEAITNAAHLFRWKKKDFGFLAAGAMVTSRVCGALPIRPHLWVTGSAGQGKSTLFDRFLNPLISTSHGYFKGATTEAGVRQSLRSNAVPILFDEFETHGQGSEEKIRATLDLMRISWSGTDGSIVKGSAGGNAISYEMRFSAIVSSIRQVHLSDADRSRFATIELKPHQEDLVHWGQLDSALNQITPELSERLFARIIKLLPVLLQNFKTIKGVMKSSSRFSDQYGMLLAGYSVLLEDEPMDVEQAKFLTEAVSLEDERDVAGIADHEMALNHLLTTKYSYDVSMGKKDDLIGDLIAIATRHPETLAEKALLQLGIRIDLESRMLIISDSHSELENKVFRNTRWSNAWSMPFSRLPGAVKSKSALRILGKAQRCTSIPLPQ